MLSAAQGDVEMRKGELKQIDAKLMRIMKVLEHTQEANLRPSHRLGPHRKDS